MELLSGNEQASLLVRGLLGHSWLSDRLTFDRSCPRLALRRAFSERFKANCATFAVEGPSQRSGDLRYLDQLVWGDLDQPSASGARRQWATQAQGGRTGR